MSFYEENEHGNFLNPATDCSEVVENAPDSKSGVYWIKTRNGPTKASLMQTM